MRLIFETIRFKNLLGYGNTFTEIPLNQDKMSFFIGRNGQGKSTILDALCFVLYKNSFRDINLPLLVNSVNKKNMLVECEFSVGQDKYLVRRGLKPTIFEIHKNGVLQDQDAKIVDYQNDFERNVLKMNFKTFKTNVIMGSRSFVPFMKLKAADRREVIEDLVNLKYISTMNALQKDALSTLNKRLEDVEMEIRFARENFQLETRALELMQNSTQSQVDQNERKAIEIDEKLRDAQISVESIQEHIVILLEQVQDENNIILNFADYSKKRMKAEMNISKLKDDNIFFSNSTNCPTCRQVIDSEFRCEEMTKNDEKISMYESALNSIIKIIDKFETRIEDIRVIQNQIRELNIELAVHNTSINHLNNSKRQLLTELSTLSVPSEQIEEQREKISTWKKTERALEKEKASLLDDIEIYRAAALILKDEGYKAQEVKRLLPTMNALINKYLTILEFPCQFELDETFSETIKSKYRETFVYESFSEGQKLRIDLALLFAWRAISKSRNSASTNLLIIDEIFESALDMDGLDGIFDCIQKLTADNNCIVISPRGDHMSSKFDTVYKFEMVKSFTKMSKEK